MNVTKSILIFASIIFLLQHTHAQQTTIQQVRKLQSSPALYNAHKITEKIILDGKMDEIWAKAPWSSPFSDIEGDGQPVPPLKTQFKMLWDDNNLYIYAKLEEPHIWASIQQRDAIIYHDNDFEVFLKPNPSSPLYYELEINPHNTVMDLLMPKPYRFGGQALMHWDIQKLQTALHVEGTLNNPDDKDSYWSVEIAIPFQSLTKFGTRKTPSLNSHWRMNFSRVQWQHQLENGQYSRKKENQKFLPEDNWVWSPIGLINMHYPERWGYIYFTADSTIDSYPASYCAERTAWNIHYLQQIHRNKEQQYAAELSSLEGYSEFLKEDLKNFDVQITVAADKSFYRVSLKEKNSTHFFTIDNHGNYTTNYEQ